MKRQFLIKKIEKCDMRPVSLEKTLIYCKIQESLRFENLTKKCFYMFFSTLKYIIQAQSKANH